MYFTLMISLCIVGLTSTTIYSTPCVLGSILSILLAAYYLLLSAPPVKWEVLAASHRCGNFSPERFSDMAKVTQLRSCGAGIQTGAPVLPEPESCPPHVLPLLCRCLCRLGRSTLSLGWSCRGSSTSPRRLAFLPCHWDLISSQFSAPSCFHFS